MSLLLFFLLVLCMAYGLQDERELRESPRKGILQFLYSLLPYSYESTATQGNEVIRKVRRETNQPNKLQNDAEPKAPPKTKPNPSLQPTLEPTPGTVISLSPIQRPPINFPLPIMWPPVEIPPSLTLPPFLDLSMPKSIVLPPNMIPSFSNKLSHQIPYPPIPVSFKIPPIPPIPTIPQIHDSSKDNQTSYSYSRSMTSMTSISGKSYGTTKNFYHNGGPHSLTFSSMPPMSHHTSYSMMQNPLNRHEGQYSFAYMSMPSMSHYNSLPMRSMTPKGQNNNGDHQAMMSMTSIPPVPMSMISSYHQHSW